jgi:hypothetical protein
MHPQLPNDFPVTETREAAHSSRYDDRVIPALGDARQILDTAALAPSLNQLPGDIASYLERLSDSSPLCDQPGKLIRRGEENSFRQLFDLYLNRQLHAT